MPVVLHDWSDKELAGWLRGLLKTIELPIPVTRIGNRETTPPVPGEVHIVVRDDGGTRHDLVLKDQQVGLSFITTSVGDLPAVRLVADMVIAHMIGRMPVDDGTPVADVTEVNGPYTVPTGNDSLRLYASMTLSLTGRELAP